ncbi:MAG: hypothetical protein H0W89_01855 [Candidatus Levybacteria bacterium]|nr:hypothetical protein [Candidatus Levybacteria bacterium]
MATESFCGTQDRCVQCPVIKYQDETIKNKKTRIADSLQQGMRALDRAAVADSESERTHAYNSAQYFVNIVDNTEASIPATQRQIGELTLNCEGPRKIRNVLTLGRTIYECDSRSKWRNAYRKIRFFQALYAEAKMIYQMRKATTMNIRE